MNRWNCAGCSNIGRCPEVSKTVRGSDMPTRTHTVGTGLAMVFVRENVGAPDLDMT